MEAASIDVVNLYSHIRHTDGIAAIKEFLIRSNKDHNCVNFICEALDFVPTHNAFQYGDKWFSQKMGVAMGTPVAPTLANLFLAIWEENFIYVRVADSQVTNDTGYLCTKVVYLTKRDNKTQSRTRQKINGKLLQQINYSPEPKMQINGTR